LYINVVRNVTKGGKEHVTLEIKELQPLRRRPVC
jgi:hypothetical protein